VFNFIRQLWHTKNCVGKENCRSCRLCELYTIRKEIIFFICVEISKQFCFIPFLFRSFETPPVFLSTKRFSVRKMLKTFKPSSRISVNIHQTENCLNRCYKKYGTPYFYNFIDYRMFVCVCVGEGRYNIFVC
jgi:hypothetical protein